MESNGCSERDCEGVFYAKDLCKKHYNAMLRESGRQKVRICKAKDCDRKAWSGFYCQPHQIRHRENRMDVPIREYGREGCSVEGCPDGHYGNGLCRAHYKKPAQPRSTSEANLRTKYGIYAAEYGAIFDSQNGLCAICHEPPAEGKVLVVDHDHSHCGGPRSGCRYCVRGLLCNRCNLRLGRIEDVEWLRAAREYLAAPTAYAVIEAPTPRPPRPFAEVERLLKELGIRNPRGVIYTKD